MRYIYLSISWLEIETYLKKNFRVSKVRQEDFLIYFFFLIIIILQKHLTVKKKRNNHTFKK